jgi:hypothetical protein
MNKHSALSLLRALFTFGGSFIMGQSIGTHAVDANTWGIVSGSIITLIGSVWGYFDKSASIEGVQSAMRSALQVLGGVGVSYGLLKADTLLSILAIVPAIIPIAQSYTSRLKVKQVDSGKLITTATGKVTPSGPQIK